MENRYLPKYHPTWATDKDRTYSRTLNFDNEIKEIWVLSKISDNDLYNRVHDKKITKKIVRFFGPKVQSGRHHMV